MRLQEIYLRDYDWTVRAYYNVDSCYPLIIDDLESIGCTDAEQIMEAFKKNGLNSGFTYTSPEYNTSILIIGNGK